MTIRTETIVTRYEVNTVSHEQGVDRIRQKQQQLALQLKDWNESARETERVHAQAWKAVAIGIAGVGVAIVGARAAFQSYAQQQRLESKTLAVNFDALSEAAGGLQTRLELMQFAAAATSGEFKLSGAQMETAQKAMRALTQQGFAQEEVTKKVTDAIIKLEGDGLKDFGIRVRQASDDSEKFSAIMEALAGKATQVDGSANEGSESIERLGVRFEDTFDRIKKAIGDMVVAMGPLIEATASLAEAGGGLIGKISDGYGILASAAGAVFGVDGAEDEFYRRTGQGSAAEWSKNRRGEATYDRFEQIAANGGDPYAQIADAYVKQGIRNAQVQGLLEYQRRLTWVNQNRDAAIEIDGERKRGGGRRRQMSRAEAYSGVALFDDTGGNLGPAAGSQGFGAENESARDDWDMRHDLEDIAHRGDMARLDELSAKAKAWREESAAIAQQRTSMLEGIFGPVGQFNVYAKGFEMLTGAVGSAYDAWRSGGESAGAAFKKFVGESLAASGKQMAIEAVKEGAWALASLAIGDVSGAARHGAAAAAFAGGAIVAGVAAKELGAGGSAGDARGPVPVLGAGAGTGPREDRNITIVTSHPFAEETARQRQLSARRVVNRAMGTGGTVYA
jgi:hypothetical protein